MLATVKNSAVHAVFPIWLMVALFPIQVSEILNGLPKCKNR